MRRALALLLLASCGPRVADYAYTSDGRLLRHPEGDHAIVASAARDIACPEPAIGVRYLAIGTIGEGKARRSYDVAIADGCGRRAVYRPECADDFSPDDPNAQAKRERSWPFEAREKTLVCRIVLLSRVELR